VRTGSSVAYLDSSALVKLVIEEDESGELRRAAEAWPRRMSSRVALVEVLRAVRRRDRAAEPLARHVLARTRLLVVGDTVLAGAVELEPAPLRAIDAIHIASARRLGPQLTAFVSYDEKQLQAAAAIGLPIASPA
jgi:uncharacterized protein